MHYRQGLSLSIYFTLGGYSMGRTTVYNPIVSDYKYKLVCSENDDLLKEFVEFCQSTDKSPLTIKNYISDIKICFIWNLDFNKNKVFIQFTKRDFMKYQNYLLNTLNLSPNRIRRMRSALSSMANFVENMLDDEYPTYRNIVNKIPAPVKEAVREKTVLTDEQAQTLLDFLVETKQYQKACVFALAWASGSRKSELVRFKVSYFINENIVYGSLYKTPEKIKTKGRGKLGKMLNRFVLVNKFKPYLELWLKEREALGITNDELFVTKQEGQWQPMKVSTLDSWTIYFSKQLSVDFYFHCLRHNFTTGLVQAGIPASVIKDIQGWSSLEMVSIYDDTEIDDKLEQYFDESGIKKGEEKKLSELK
jgi:integrase